MVNPCLESACDDQARLAPWTLEPRLEEDVSPCPVYEGVSVDLKHVGRKVDLYGILNKNLSNAVLSVFDTFYRKSLE
jgi:hypothetical protein